MSQQIILTEFFSLPCPAPIHVSFPLCVYTPLSQKCLQLVCSTTGVYLGSHWPHTGGIIISDDQAQRGGQPDSPWMKFVSIELQNWNTARPTISAQNHLLILTESLMMAFVLFCPSILGLCEFFYGTKFICAPVSFPRFFYSFSTAKIFFVFFAVVVWVLDGTDAGLHVRSQVTISCGTFFIRFFPFFLLLLGIFVQRNTIPYHSPSFFCMFSACDVSICHWLNFLMKADRKSYPDEWWQLDSPIFLPLLLPPSLDWNPCLSGHALQVKI